MKKIILLTIAVLMSASSLQALRVDDIVKNIRIRDTRDIPAYLPDFGQKVLVIFYNDADVADQNDHVARILKKLKLPRHYYRPIGIGNLKDAPWKPDPIIRLIARRKEKKYNVTILTDPSYILRDAWGLGNCNDKSVFLIINSKGRILYIYHGKMPDAEIKKAVSIITEEIEFQKKINE